MKAEVKTVDKRWGREIWFANNKEKDYCGKILEIDPDNQLSLRFHIKPGTVHRFSTKNGCTLLEASTFHRDSDSHRVAE